MPTSTLRSRHLKELKPKLSPKHVRYFEEPDLFSEVQLQRTLWAKQREIALAIERYPMTAVKGCHASGKTFVASGLPLYWLIRYQKSKAFVTAPTLRQVKAFWDEIAIARAGSLLTSLLPEPTTVRLELNRERYAYGASSSRGVNTQGLHSDNVLIIVDEAPGIDEAIWDAIHGIRAGGNVKVLKLGNPVVPVGDFFDAFTKDRASHHCISISAFDTPNLQHPVEQRPLTIEEVLAMEDDELDWCPFPFLIRRRFVKERYLAWGPNHPKYRSRVLAEFPTQSPYAVFELAWIEKAKRDPTEKELEMATRLTIQVGIDVAGPGDDETTLTARIGGMILEQHAWADPDPIGPVIKVLHSLRNHPKYRLGIIVVDVTGIGYYFARRLVEAGFNVYGFNASQRAMDAEQFKNGKSEAYFTAREYFKSGEISGLRDDECEAQLTTMLYHETNLGKTEIRSKDYMREELQVPSPDRAESLIMAFMRVVAREVTHVFGGPGTYQISPY